MNPPHNEINEDLLTRWIDGQLTPEEAARVEQHLATDPQFLRDKQGAVHVRSLLRTHLPASVEPPSPEFFTSSVMEEIRREVPAARSAPAKRESAWRAWLRTPWFAPVASAAVVALAFILFWRPNRINPSVDLLAQAYTPDPSITATVYVSEEAEATVIDLQNATVPDNQNIEAFDVASADPPAPGEPQILFAASDTARPVMVLSLDSAQKPKVNVVR